MFMKERQDNIALRLTRGPRSDKVSFFSPPAAQRTAEREYREQEISDLTEP